MLALSHAKSQASYHSVRQVRNLPRKFPGASALMYPRVSLELFRRRRGNGHQDLFYNRPLFEPYHLLRASEDRPSANLFFRYIDRNLRRIFARSTDHTTSSAYRLGCVLYDGVILQQSQLGHRILARKKSVVGKLLVAERTPSRPPPNDQNEIRCALERFENTGTQLRAEHQTRRIDRENKP